MRDREMDDMEALIREAANSHHPVYDDKAWDKMQALLDKHLPVKKSNKRFAALFLLLIILGSGFFTAFYLWPAGKKISPEKNKPASAVSFTSKIPTAIPGDQTNRQGDLGKNSESVIAEGQEFDADKNFTGSAFKKYRFAKKAHVKTTAEDADEQGVDPEGNLKAGYSYPEKYVGTNEVAINAAFVSLADPQKYYQGKTSVPPVISDSAGNAVVKKAGLSKKIPGKSPANKTGGKGFENNFAITFSAGPDLGFVGLKNASGKARLNYGAGLSYTFANRYTVSSGFYVANKSYSAKGTDYHPPKGYWTYNTDLRSVYANCKVYEIPVSVNYKISQSKRHNIFAGVGFSTFLMKKEAYSYSYKDAWGQAMEKDWTLLNGGNQYFSVLTISGGYQYKLSRTVAIAAEPYFKLPLQGIGFGKTRLNSGGLLITASIRPFAKRK